MWGSYQHGVISLRCFRASRLSRDTVEGEKYKDLSPSIGICILLYNIPVAVLDEAADGDVER